jgi:hypothetical protein
VTAPALAVRDRRRAPDGRLAVVRYITNGAVSYKVGKQWGSLPVAEFLAEFPEPASPYMPLPHDINRHIPKPSTLRYRRAALRKELETTIETLRRKARGWLKSARSTPTPELQERKERLGRIYGELADFAEQRMFREFSEEETIED